MIENLKKDRFSFPASWTNNPLKTNILTIQKYCNETSMGYCKKYM